MPLDATSIITAATDLDERLGRQIEFILELDQLKAVLRRSLLVDGSRNENTAEHSWHLAMMALLLAEWAGPEVDVVEATKAVLVHDIVEIDAGDTYIYDETGRETKDAAEEAAANRLFGLLPPDQGAELRRLWDLYERSRHPHRPLRLRPRPAPATAAERGQWRGELAPSRHPGRPGPHHERPDRRCFGAAVGSRPAHHRRGRGGRRTGEPGTRHLTPARGTCTGPSGGEASSLWP